MNDEIISLEKMQEFCRDIIDNIAAVPFAEFERERDFQYSALFCLIQIGELANLIRDFLEQNAKEIPWGQIIALRHRIVHHYFKIRLSDIWDTLQNDIGPLREQLRQILDGIGC
jgi:uncharacterized protein with HEPN domain